MSHFPHVEDLNIEECDNLEDFLYPHQQPLRPDLPPLNDMPEQTDQGMVEDSDRFGNLDDTPSFGPKFPRRAGSFGDAYGTPRIGYEESLGDHHPMQNLQLTTRDNYDNWGYSVSPQLGPAESDTMFTRAYQQGPNGQYYSGHNVLEASPTYTQASSSNTFSTSMTPNVSAEGNDTKSTPIVTRGRGRVLRSKRSSHGSGSDSGKNLEHSAKDIAAATTVTRSDVQSVISSNTGYSGDTNSRKVKKNNRERQRRFEVNEKFAELADVLGVVQKNKSDKVSVLQSAIDSIQWFQSTYGPVDIHEVVNTEDQHDNDAGSLNRRKRSAGEAGMKK